MDLDGIDGSERTERFDSDRGSDGYTIEYWYEVSKEESFQQSSTYNLYTPFGSIWDHPGIQITINSTHGIISQSEIHLQASLYTNQSIKSLGFPTIGGSHAFDGLKRPIRRGLGFSDFRYVRRQGIRRLGKALGKENPPGFWALYRVQTLERSLLFG